LPRPDVIALRAPHGPALAGLSWAASPGAPGILVIPGFGSRKENHADFASAAAARGMGALALDVRGHGASGGELDGGVMDDVMAGLEALSAQGLAPLGVRGSSMGGLLALHAAARDRRVRAVVAICPARPAGLARRVGAPWPLALEPGPVVARHDGIARGYWHATGDDRVPWGSTLALAGLTPHPMRLHVAMGGTHGSLQHDAAVIGETVAFLHEHLAAG
jgi:pimeloyl-ACP methyl ester carboxylesterase